MSDAAIAHFSLYGERPQDNGPRFIHVEALEVRSRPGNWTIRPHLHRDLHQVFLVTEGAGDICLDAERHRLMAPLLVLAPAGVVHAFTWPPRSNGFVLTVAEPFFREVTAAHPDLATLFDRAACLEISDPMHARHMADDLSRFMLDAVWQGPFAEAALEAHLLLALVSAGRLASNTVERRQLDLSGAAQIVSGFRASIEQRFRTPATIADYASDLRIPEKKLREACRQVLDQSPLQQVRRRRGLEAQRLLTYSSMTVAEIGYSIGFIDPAYFSRVFRDDFGMSPAQFRRARGSVRHVRSEADPETP